ncbi:MAG: efflux RND transporter permease subunit, partial [Casimicrobiaceae bacterium]
QAVQAQGVQVLKANPALVMAIALTSKNPSFDYAYLNNLAGTLVADAIKRLPGTGNVQQTGYPYSMRLWLNPQRLADLSITVNDIINVVKDQNNNYSTGQVGLAPSPTGQVLTIPILTKGYLSEVSEFENLIVRALSDGASVRIKDVARVELGAQDYTYNSRINGAPAAVLLVSQLSGANAVQLSKDVRRAMTNTARIFPEGVGWSIPYDSTKFITASIEEVIVTFFEALALVMLVVFLFLGNWRSTLVPMLVVPVSIIGAFIGMGALGFTINTLTLFGMVLAIGLVVDDAILVVERVEELMEDEHLAPREATKRAMQQLTGPIVAVMAVLSSVFLPTAFIPGLAGKLYQQFAVTITLTMLLSALMAMSLTPALCALLLKPKPEGERRGFFGAFNRGFKRVTGHYVDGVRYVLGRRLLFVAVFGVIVGGVVYNMISTPTGFLPDEDQGFFFVTATLPVGASLEQTGAVTRQLEDYFRKDPAVADVLSLNGFGLYYNAPSIGTVIVTLKPWDERKAPAENALNIIAQGLKDLGAMQDAKVIPSNPPAISGLSLVSGFDYYLQEPLGDRALLNRTAATLVETANRNPDMRNIVIQSAPYGQQLFVDLDRAKATSLGLTVSDVMTAVGGMFGPMYVNNFVKFGRVLQVRLEADQAQRKSPDDFLQIYVRNNKGEMVPVKSVLKTEWITGPLALDRFQGFPAIHLVGQSAPGKSSGEAITAMAAVSAQVIPAGMEFQWSGQTLQQIISGKVAPYIFALSLIVVFLCLAAMYESWAVPIAVMLTVPIGVLGALSVIHIRGLDNDVYFQIGLVTIIGLAAKNGILLVESCKRHHEEDGMTPLDACLTAVRLRLRPIFMTSLAFILGVLPLAFATGAGANARHSVGTGVAGGMLFDTLLAIIFVPLFYYLIVQWKERGTPAANAAPPPPTRSA